MNNPATLPHQNMSTRRFLLSVGGIIFVLIAATYLFVISKNTDYTPSTTQTTITPQNVVNSNVEPDLYTVSYEGKVGTSVLDLLSQHAQAETKDSSFGTYVDTINGITGGTDSKYWLFYVNGEPATVGASEYMTHDGDLIEWRFE